MGHVRQRGQKGRGEHPCRGGRHRDARPAGKVGRGRGGGKWQR